MLWNIGEPPVEGYSSFSFLVLSYVGMTLNLDPVLLSKIVGFFGLVLTTWSVYLLSRLWCSFWFAFIPCFWLLMYKAQILWAVSGMETAVYQALICFSIFFLLRGNGYNLYPMNRIHSNRLFLGFAGLLFALAALTRPEAPAIIFLLYTLALWDRPPSSQAYYWHFLASVLVFLSIFLPYFLWRWHYFGRLFPNTIYCKAFSNSFSYEFDWDYIRFAWPFLLLAAIASYKPKDKRPYFFWLPTVAYLIFLWKADPISAFFNRLFLPIFALILPLALQGLMRLIDKYTIKMTWSYALNLYLIAFGIALFFIPAMSLREYSVFTENPQRGSALRENVARWLNQHVPEGSRVALADVGLIAYKSNLSFLDTYCLNNKGMTQESHQNMYEWECNEVMRIKPEVLVLHSSLREDGQLHYTPTDRCLLERLKTSLWYHHEICLKFCSSYKSDCLYYEIYTKNNH